MIRKRIVKWLFPTVEEETVERLTKKREPVKVFKSRDLEIDQEKQREKEEKEEKLPHETINT